MNSYRYCWCENVKHCHISGWDEAAALRRSPAFYHPLLVGPKNSLWQSLGGIFFTAFSHTAGSKNACSLIDLRGIIVWCRRSGPSPTVPTLLLILWDDLAAWLQTTVLMPTPGPLQMVCRSYSKFIIGLLGQPLLMMRCHCADLDLSLIFCRAMPGDSTRKQPLVGEHNLTQLHKLSMQRCFHVWREAGGWRGVVGCLAEYWVIFQGALAHIFCAGSFSVEGNAILLIWFVGLTESCHILQFDKMT